MSEKRRVNLYIDEGLLATLDAYTRVAQVSRTELIHQLLYPSKTVLDELLRKADSFVRLSDEQKVQSMRNLDRLERGVMSVLDQVNSKVEDL